MNKVTLVIVDDDRSFVEAISIFLKDHGFYTVPTLSGQESLTWFQSNRADLAIIDVHLPDISGIEVADRLHRTSKAPPLILISSDD